MPAPDNGLGAILATLTPKLQERALDEATDEMAEHTLTMYRALLEQASFSRPRPAIRLQMYRLRSPAAWAILQALDPSDYHKTMKDWRELEEKDVEKRRAAQSRPEPQAEAAPVVPPAAY